FDSKERLLLETLSRLSAEYDANWREELMAAEPLPAARLRALVASDLAPRICAPEKVAAWFAFFAEAAARPHFRELCWDRDDAYLAAMTSACEALEREEGYGLDPAKTAMSIYAMQEGLWLRLMLGNAEMSRTDALDLSLGLLGTLFPRHFTPEGDLRADR
ncbi:MAG: TetR family transcriptional regulator C-terminal domain-containing protein, partial [Pseudomonadota bacterium]